MIFLKKFLLVFILTAALAMSGYGCSAKNKPNEDSEAIAATSQPYTERDVPSASGNYVYDEKNVLSAEDKKAVNDYAEWLYKEKLINPAVIITDDIRQKAPLDYTVERFNEIYEGKGSGLIILINNDTNEDIVYKTGSCYANIDDTSQNNAMFWSTKETVNGDLRKGIMRLLQLGEICPLHIIDNAQVFDSNKIAALEKSLASCKKEMTLLASRNGSAQSNEDILKNYYKRKYGDSEGIMLMIDTNKKTIIAYSDGGMPKELESALKEADSLASKEDYYGAAGQAIEALGGKMND